MATERGGEGRGGEGMVLVISCKTWVLHVSRKTQVSIVTGKLNVSESYVANENIN